jgi:hypothetical protein
MNEALMKTGKQGRPPAWWRVAPGVTWIQCHDPVTVERVRKLKGARLVARGVNVYLRTYEVPHPLAWVEALMTKPQNPPSNKAFFSANGASCGAAARKVSA